MTKLLAPIAAATVLAGLAAATPAAAQQQSQPRVNRIVVFGDDPCPRSTDDDVYVCARKGESERYRIPEEYRSTGDRQQSQSWSANVRYLETVNTNGINQCDPVGPAGQLGCLQKLIDQNRERREEADEELAVPE